MERKKNHDASLHRSSGFCNRQHAPVGLDRVAGPASLALECQPGEKRLNRDQYLQKQGWRAVELEGPNGGTGIPGPCRARTGNVPCALCTLLLEPRQPDAGDPLEPVRDVREQAGVARSVPAADQRYRLAQVGVAAGADHQQGAGTGQVV